MNNIIFFKNQKKLQKLKAFSLWISDVFSVGLNRQQLEQCNRYNNEIQSMTHISNSMYTEYKMKLLSLAVIAEYRDDEDATGEQKKKIYTCYRKHNGKVHNDLLLLIDYVLRFYQQNDMHRNVILQTQQEIIQHYQPIMNYKEYFTLKNRILTHASYGIRVDIDYHPDNIYRVVARTYNRTDQQAQNELHRVLAVVDTLRRRQNMIINHEREIEEGIISY